MTNEQKARFLDYALTLADHVIDGKPSFLPQDCFHDKHTFDGVTVADMHDIIGDWDSDIYCDEHAGFPEGITLSGFDDDDEEPADADEVLA